MQDEPRIRHFLDLADLSGSTLRAVIDEAHRRKRNRAGLPKGAADKDMPLAGRLLAMIFDRPSTRTRISFDVAMRQLGGQCLVINQNDMQLERGESLSDTAQVLSRYVDAIIMRTDIHEHVMELAHHASVPVINGLTAYSHPCQLIADIMTFEEHKGAIAGQKIAWLGDGNNMATSWIQAAVLLGFELRLAVPDAHRPPQSVLDWARQKTGEKTTGGHISVLSDSVQAVQGVAAVNTDCWVSMSDDAAMADRRAQALSPFQVNDALMAQTDNALFMHCLPAYRGKEVTASVMNGTQAVVFDEAENRIYAQKAILHWCLNGLPDKRQA